MIGLTVVSLIALSPLPQEDPLPDLQRSREMVLLREAKAEYRVLIQQRLGLHITQMQDFLKLDPVASRKLSLASKGAAKQVVEEFSGNLSNYLRRHAAEPTISINGRILQLPQADETVDTEPIAPAQAAMRIILTVRFESVGLSCRTPNSSTGYGMGNGGYGKALEQKVWKETLAKVATPEQLRAFARYQAEDRRERGIQLLLSVLHLDLQIKKSQQEALRNWVTDQIKTVPKSDIQSGARWAISRLGKRLSPDGLDRILSKEQVRLFQGKLADWMN